MVLLDYKTRLDQILKEQAGHLDEADKEAAIQNALKEHSKYKPLALVYDIAGDGVAFDFATSTITSWEKDFSKILSIELPAGDREPVYLNDDDWTLYEKPSGQVLRLLFDTPAAGQSARVNYTARHPVDRVDGRRRRCRPAHEGAGGGGRGRARAQGIFQSPRHKRGRTDGGHGVSRSAGDLSVGRKSPHASEAFVMGFKIQVRNPIAFLQPGAPAPGMKSLEEGLIEMGALLEREVKIRTPLGATKLLRGSIFSEPRGNPVREVVVGSTSIYAPMVEVGR